ncbi:MAG TPA: hypothetical protein VFQ35_09650 [Polyangiaceae bacterium]|nr:hypothetical protein [Polyangiaceae bacterium]
MTGEIVSVDLQALMPATPKRLEYARALRSKLKAPAPKRDGVLAEGTFLPRAVKSKKYLYFHLDQEKEGAAAADLFLHMIWSPRPQRPPPAEVQKRHDEGVTAEVAARAVFGLVAADAEGGNAFSWVDAELLVEGWTPPIGPLAPVLHKGSVLEQVGAEYRAPEGATVALKRLRWRREPKNKAKIWLTYWDETDFRYKALWDTVKARCLELLEGLG